MGPKVFKAKYTLVLKTLILMYAIPWLFSIPNAIFGQSGGDWKLFWLLAGTVWAVSGILHMRSLLVKKVVFANTIRVEMPLLTPSELEYGGTVHIYGDLVRFENRDVSLQYLANGQELVKLLTSYAHKGRLTLVYEQHDHGAALWSTTKNLICLMIFVLYMMVIVGLKYRPMNIIGLATDAFLLGWAVMLPVLLIIKLIHWFKDQIAHNQVDYQNSR